MAIQMYIVQIKDGESDSDREAVAAHIAGVQGFILMATSADSLIVACDERFADGLRAHPAVDFVGGVSFNPSGPLVERLQHLFAQNVASQLVERGTQVPGPGAQAPGESAQKQADFPPGYRPLRWPKT